MKKSKLHFYMLLSLPLYFTNAYADTAIAIDANNRTDGPAYLRLNMVDAATQNKIPLKTDLSPCKNYEEEGCEIPKKTENYTVPFTNTQTFDAAFKFEVQHGINFF